jgi:hypothetical protein
MLVNSLNHFSVELPVKIKKRKVNLKGLLKTLRRKWRRGPYTEFDKLLAANAHISIERAEQIREKWLDLDFLAYDKEGFLIWYGGSMT